MLARDRMSFKRKAQQTAFELAFVVTRDNAILDKLQFLGFIADLAQVSSAAMRASVTRVVWTSRQTRCST